MRELLTTPPNHALQRTRPPARGCNQCLPRAGSLSLGRCVGLFRSRCEESHAVERKRYSRRPKSAGDSPRDAAARGDEDEGQSQHNDAGDGAMFFV